MCGLLVQEVGGVVDVLIDQVLVLDVDERCEEGEGGEEESETPWWCNLDEEIGQEGCCERLRGCQLASR